MSSPVNHVAVVACVQIWGNRGGRAEYNHDWGKLTDVWTLTELCHQNLVILLVKKGAHAAEFKAPEVHVKKKSDEKPVYENVQMAINNPKYFAVDVSPKYVYIYIF